MVDDTAEAIFAAEDDHIDLSMLVRLGGWGLGAAAALTVAIVAGQSDIGSKRVTTALASVPANRPTAASLLARANEPEGEARQMAETVRLLAADRDHLANRLAALERNLDDLTGSIPRVPPPARAGAPTITSNPTASTDVADLPAIMPNPAAKAAKAPEVSTPKVASPPAAPPPSASPQPSPPAPHPAAETAAPRVVLPAPAAAQVPPAQTLPAQAPPAQAPPAQAPPAQAPPAQVPLVQIPPAQVLPGQIPPAAVPPGQIPLAQAPSAQVLPAQVPPARVAALPAPVAPGPPAPTPGAPTPALQNPATRVVTLPIAPPPAPDPAADHADMAADNAGADSVATKTEFALDVGGATSMQGLRLIWASLKSKHPALVDGLRPLVAVRETTRPGSMQLRLIVGPLADAGAAARLCAILASTGRLCETALFDGQRLVLR